MCLRGAADKNERFLAAQSTLRTKTSGFWHLNQPCGQKRAVFVRDSVLWADLKSSAFEQKL
jgi:hypothetical protein